MDSNQNLALCVPRQSSGYNTQKPVIAPSSTTIECPPNHVLIKVERFGFSANNITYQALGEHPHFRYFDFHPSPTAGEVSLKTHGLIPVWGFGTIISSTHPKIQKGERVYGYFAPVRYLLVPVSPSDVNKHCFYVPRPHLPADRRPYNQILRCAADPQYTATPLAEDLTMLYRPLFWTSYWCEDWLNSSGYRGGITSILVSSASSKTAFCLAYLIGKRSSRGEISKDTRIIGLTSNRNVAFTKGLGLYNEVFDYDSFASTKALNGKNDLQWIYVDVAGNDDLNARIFGYFASSHTGTLSACVSLGMTNLSPASSVATSMDWTTNTFSAPQEASPSPGKPSALPKLEPFFMVEWLNVRKHELDIKEIFERQNQAWTELIQDCVRWVKLERVYGAGAVKNAYERLAKEGLGPDKGLIWSLWDNDNYISSARL